MREGKREGRGERDSVEESEGKRVRSLERKRAQERG
mgnify:CR=1 FL=1